MPATIDRILSNSPTISPERAYPFERTAARFRYEIDFHFRQLQSFRRGEGIDEFFKALNPGKFRITPIPSGRINSSSEL
jgi:hypothetical protein